MGKAPNWNFVFQKHSGENILGMKTTYASVPLDTDLISKKTMRSREDPHGCKRWCASWGRRSGPPRVCLLLSFTHSLCSFFPDRLQGSERESVQDWTTDEGQRKIQKPTVSRQWFQTERSKAQLKKEMCRAYLWAQATHFERQQLVMSMERSSWTQRDH